jgi:hypothetical protein
LQSQLQQQFVGDAFLPHVGLSRDIWRMRACRSFGIRGRSSNVSRVFQHFGIEEMDVPPAAC